MKILVLSGSNHGFDKSAPVIAAFLSQQPAMQVTVADDKAILTAPQLNEYDVCVFGTGFTRSSRQEDGTIKREPDLTPAQEAGLFSFVEGGKGLVGIHGTAWWIGGRAVDLRRDQLQIASVEPQVGATAGRSVRNEPDRRPDPEAHHVMLGEGGGALANMMHIRAQAV